MAAKVGQPLVGLMLPSIPHHADGRLEKKRIIDAARLAEQSGFDSVYIGDHLLHPNPLMEALVTLSMVAAVTERVTIGTCVMLMALREPLWLAKQLGTLDLFAPGRLRIGIGVGGAYPGEFDAAGVPLPQRGRRTEEVLRAVRDAFAGQLPDLEDAGIEVHLKPVPREPVPFLFAGREDAPLRRAARCGDGWIGYLLSPAGFAERRAFLLSERAGNPAPFSCGMLFHVQPDDRLEGAHDRALAGWRRVTNQTSRPFPNPEELFIAGPPDAIAAQLHRFRDAGCDEMVLVPADQGAAYPEQAHIIASEVLPRLRAAG
jgi:alkanesulfonate monooxygenase SsuD/methylene tetrahydromethanopterin reductase-like flavin-dependent oxidoreductase (luciferase family)